VLRSSADQTGIFIPHHIQLGLKLFDSGPHFLLKGFKSFTSAMQLLEFHLILLQHFEILFKYSEPVFESDIQARSFFNSVATKGGLPMLRGRYKVGKRDKYWLIGL